MLIAAYAAGLLALQTPDPELRWKPKVNDRLTYEYSLEAVGGQAMSVTAYLDILVTQASESGFTTRTVSRGALVSMGGNEIRDNRPNPVTARFGMRGDLMEILEGAKDRGAYDLGRATKFVAPPQAVKVGETWSFNFAAEPELGVKASTWTGKFEGMTQLRSGSQARITYTLADDDKGKEAFSAKGTWMVDPVTGIPESLTSDLTQLGGLKQGGSFKFKLTRYRERGG